MTRSGKTALALTGVSLDFGDYGDDADTLTLNAYSGLVVAKKRKKRKIAP